MELVEEFDYQWENLSVRILNIQKKELRNFFN
jgi:hypothetical protein